MRAGRRTLATFAVAFAVGASLSAHRRDEHLQAARIAIEPEHVDVDLDITPGADLAEAAILAIDGDRDGTLSPAEQDAYAQSVAGALWLATNGEAHTLRLVSATFPDPAAMRRGEGTIALRLRAALGGDVLGGDGELIFGNGHQPAHSVYLANALVPRSPRVTVRGQRRSPTQHELTIAYTLAPEDAPYPAARIVWTLAAVLVVLPIVRHVLAQRRG